MKTIDTKIPIIVFIILALSSFIPVLQVLIVYLNGALLFPFELLFNTTEIIDLNWINLIGAILSLIGYLLADHIKFKIVSICLFAFFVTSYFSFLTQRYNYESIPYFMPFLIQSIVVSFPLYLIGLFKEKKSN